MLVRAKGPLKQFSLYGPKPFRWRRSFDNQEPREDAAIILTELALEYNERKSGIMIVSSEAGFVMCRPEYHEYIKRQTLR